jgi:hypothetical protein
LAARAGIAFIATTSVAGAEELLLACTLRSQSDKSAKDVEIAARIDTDKRTATWGDGNNAQSVTITADAIKFELPPFDISAPSVCPEKLYLRQSISINRINGQIFDSQIADLPSYPCHREYIKAGIEMWPSDVLIGKCVKATKRAF